MDYYRGVLSAVAAVIAPYLSGSSAIPALQEPPSVLEKKIELDWQWSWGNGHNRAYNQSVIVPFHRGIRREARKSPVPVPQRVHGYRTPRECYRKRE